MTATRTRYTYEEIIELHRQKTLRHIADLLDVPWRVVHFVGITDTLPVYHMCLQCPPELPPEYPLPLPIVSMPPTIKLDREYEHVDNVLNRKTNLFVGQCEECGHVYVAEARYSRY